MHVYCETQLVLHCYTVVSCQTKSSPSVHKYSAVISRMQGLCCYAPLFEEVEEAYWFVPLPAVLRSVRPSIRLSIMFALGQEPLQIGS